jgi:hypothetical protein
VSEKVKEMDALASAYDCAAKAAESEPRDSVMATVCALIAIAEELQRVRAELRWANDREDDLKGYAR